MQQALKNESGLCAFLHLHMSSMFPYHTVECQERRPDRHITCAVMWVFSYTLLFKSGHECHMFGDPCVRFHFERQ